MTKQMLDYRAASSQYYGCFIKHLPILRPFKSQFHSIERGNTGIGVFIVIPFQDSEDADILDLTEVEGSPER